MSSRLSLLFALSAGQVFLFSACRNPKPVEFVPTARSASWPKFTSAEEGFEIKYPADWQRHQSPTVVTLSNGSVSVGITRLDEASRKQMEALNHYRPGLLERLFAERPKKVKVGNVTGEQVKGVVGFFDSVGNMEVETVTLMRGTDTYVINWSLGRGLSKAPKSAAAVCEEMVATFRFIELKHSDYLTYSDPMGAFAFEYPSAWILNAGGEHGSLNLMGGSPLLIRVDVKTNTSFEDFLRQQGGQVASVEEKKEHFRHHLLGRRCSWLSRETYVFEGPSKLLLVSISEAPHLGEISRKSIDDFLDSLRL